MPIANSRNCKNCAFFGTDVCKHFQDTHTQYELFLSDFLFLQSKIVIAKPSSSLVFRNGNSRMGKKRCPEGYSMAVGQSGGDNRNNPNSKMKPLSYTQSEEKGGGGGGGGGKKSHLSTFGDREWRGGRAAKLKNCFGFLAKTKYFLSKKRLFNAKVFGGHYRYIFFACCIIWEL